MKKLEHLTNKRIARTVFFLFVAILIISTPSFDQVDQKAVNRKPDYVILLHGLTRSSRSMKRIEESLSDYGYRVINVDYPSTEHPIEYLADNVLSDVIVRCEIGVRKVLGATETDILFLFSKEFSKWVILANIFSWPVGFYVLNKWLQNFAYRIRIDIWTFAFSGGIVLLIALLSISHQSLKAALADPVDSLRYE